jgi:hypothetical protein
MILRRYVLARLLMPSKRALPPELRYLQNGAAFRFAALLLRVCDK